MANCVVCDDLGCEHCPRAPDEGLRVDLKMILLQRTVMSATIKNMLDLGADPTAIRFTVELIISEWCDEQGEPPVGGEIRLDRFGRSC